MKIRTAKSLTALALLCLSGCATPINLFENEDFFNTKKGDRITRGTNVVYEITQDGRWLSKYSIDLALDAKLKTK